MENEFIPYEQALALKELGLDESCLAYFTENARGKGDKLQFFVEPVDCNDDYVFVAAPLFSQAFRWFREKYKLCNNLGYTKPWKYSYHITSLEISKTFEVIDGFNTYEEAELECLKKLIELVKAQK